ncbi:MAG: glycosyltransferase [Deltaproteobacteria bacterium]|nr:glycosyltransferase [Deltaproteobacteria bacterium]
MTQSEYNAIAVSVVMPVYNSESYLSDAIRSILDQTHSNFEFIIIDDLSEDASWRIASRFASRDGRIKLFRNPTNLGIVKTRNLGFARTNPEHRYLAIMDSDDISLPRRLERQIAFLEQHPDHGLVGGNTLIIDEDSREISSRRYPSCDREIRRVITRYNPIAQPTAMLRRSVLRQVGAYDERFPRCQDYDLWCRIAARYKLANLDEYTLKYRVSSTQGKTVHLRDSLVYTIQIQREWLFHKGFVNPLNLLTFGLEHCLLWLPEPITLRLFKAITYRRLLQR